MRFLIDRAHKASGVDFELASQEGNWWPCWLRSWRETAQLHILYVYAARGKVALLADHMHAYSSRAIIKGTELDVRQFIFDR